MRAKYPGVDAAYTNSGGLRADLNCSPPSAGEQACEITWGEMFGVLPFANRTVILPPTGPTLKQAFTNGFSPVCNPAIATGRFPQVSGLRATFTCYGTAAEVTGLWRTPDGIAGTQTPITATDTVRFVTNDFMLTGGAGYTVFASGTSLAPPGSAPTAVTIRYVPARPTVHRGAGGGDSGT